MTDDDPTDSTGLFSEHKDDIDEEWHDAFDELVGRGIAPSTVKATIEYLTTFKSQSDVADEYGKSEATVQQTWRKTLEVGPLESDEPKIRARLNPQHCRNIASALRWSDGEHFAFHPDNTNSIRLKLAGWQSLYLAVCHELDQRPQLSDDATRSDYCAEIASLLDWTNTDEYSLRTNYRGANVPKLLAKGWAVLSDLVGDRD